MFSRRRLSILICFICAGLTQARAGDATFGAEFTFTNFDLVFPQKRSSLGHASSVVTEENMSAIEAMARLMMKACANQPEGERCRVRALKDARGAKIYRVEYADDWWWQISPDPSVVEIQTKPSTARELRAMKERIRRDIFATAAKTGLTTKSSGETPKPGLVPFRKVGGGHIHIGNESAFGNDAKLFRNFLVDYSNHAGLALGALGDDATNAASLGHLTPQSRAGFEDAIRAFDEGRISTIGELATAVESAAYSQDCRGQKVNPKYNALCVQRATDPKMPEAERTTEVRALRAQRTADEFLREVELFDARIKHLKTIDYPIAYNNRAANSFSDPELVSQFHSYIAGAGLNPDEYKSLLPKDLKQVYDNGKFSKQLLSAEAAPARSSASLNCPKTIRSLLAPHTAVRQPPPQF